MSDLNLVEIDYWSTSMTQSTQLRAHFPLIAMESYLFAIGGVDQNNISLSSIAKYDIENDLWFEVDGTIPVERSRHCAVEHEGEIWVLAGLRLTLK